uniref:Uncharacterized protein n=1 Tax=Tanacetum cinerariifolium TaxID=118510 RepID=A0A699JLC6_TANCI|nr:hypothetical protein [Tanacetum cinerariifolium]
MDSHESGRRFKGCPIYDKDKKCGMRGCLDDESQSNYYKDLFCKFHLENNELTLKLKILSNQDCDLVILPLITVLLPIIYVVWDFLNLVITFSDIFATSLILVPSLLRASIVLVP